MADLREFDPLRDPDVANCVRAIYNEAVKLKKTITDLVETTQSLSYFEEHHLINVDYFNGLLSTYRDLLEAHSRRYVAPEEAESFDEWVNGFTLPLLNGGAVFRRNFLAYLFNQRDKHLLNIAPTVLHEGAFGSDDYWYSNGWEKVKEDMLKIFIAGVSPYPKLGKDACHFFPDTSKRAKSGRCSHGNENRFCYNLALQRWETWHQSNS